MDPENLFNAIGKDVSSLDTLINIFVLNLLIKLSYP